ncbi:hypothetical protein [Actinacidiphila paucisporea]|uniref:Uncharacterized protein n=1 Tax=Actinacidiphila paucisporea TaxID=310782 RepID=A0A1M7PYW2_9ACTN|nr:hypothetical protein [Actinacidiphila paucisporea]SHN22940.1 hypothetical protein SAMN05216499_12756 [Actinacidiphila paucisporea]
MPPSENPLPDIAVGRHPDFGIVATNPKRLAASAWMLRGLDFHPVPGHPHLYALADQERDGPGRAIRALALLRRANYRVEVDAEFDTFPAAPGPVPAATVSQRVEPDVAFADHPRLGVIAATTDGAVAGGQLLEEHGWRRHPSLDIYVLPPATGRYQALDQVAQATVAMHRADLHVAVQPALARDVTARRPPAPTRPAPRERSPDAAERRLPSLSAAALAASPVRADLPGTPPVPEPAAPAPGPRPVDTRVAFSRTR